MILLNTQSRNDYVTKTPRNLARRVMREFKGLESADSLTRNAILNFSYFLAHGEIDAAFKSMRLIKSTAVWEVGISRSLLNPVIMSRIWPKCASPRGVWMLASCASAKWATPWVQPC